MRSRETIDKETGRDVGMVGNIHLLEVLLDIRELLIEKKDKKQNDKQK